MPMLVWLLGAALSASAHDLYPIRPVRMTLRVEPDRIVADLRADSIVWIEQVTGLHPMPAENWPADALAKVEGYANSHFILQADGKVLSAKLAEARYRQLPWEVTEEGTFFLRLIYPPAPAGATLSGAARFYEEYRTDLESELGGRPLPFADGYRTIVEIPGRAKSAFVLTTAAPSFTVSIDDARRTPLAMAFESVRRGAETALGSAAGFPTLLAIALCLGARPFDRKTASLFCAAAATGFALIGRVEMNNAVWFATLAASLSVGRKSFEIPLIFAATLALAHFWGEASLASLPNARGAWPCSFLGVASAGALLFSVVRLGVMAEYRRLCEHSESRVAELFAQRARLTATALAMVGAYGLWQSFPR